MHVTVLVRAKGSTSAESRVRSLLGKPIFTEVAEAAGGVDELMGTPVARDRGRPRPGPRALPKDLDAVVHCAGDVSFDPPVDEGFRTNVVGTRELLARVREVGDHVHYVHISTAYVAGRRRGSIPEGPVPHEADLEAELALGARPAAGRRAPLARQRPAHRRAQAGREGSTAGPAC